MQLLVDIWYNCDMNTLAFGGLGGGLLSIIPLLLFIFALVDVLRGPTIGNNKIIWVLVILLVPCLGPILYFLIGRNQVR
jgi:hypothetical protein